MIESAPTALRPDHAAEVRPMATECVVCRSPRLHYLFSAGRLQNCEM